MVGSSIRQVGDVELAARIAAVARENKSAAALATLIDMRARIIQDAPPPPGLLVAHSAARAAETRRAWSQWHRDQAERHRTTLTALVNHHEGEAERLMR